MNITTAIVFVRGTATARIEAEYIIKCSVEGTEPGADIDYNRRVLEQAFTEIYETSDVEVLFPELGECIDDDTD